MPLKPASTKKAKKKRRGSEHWNFLSNHAHVVSCIAHDPNIRLRDVASAVGITERAVQRIVADLEDAGFISRTRSGRCNRYQIHAQRPLRHPLESHQKLRALLTLLAADQGADAETSQVRPRAATGGKRRLSSTKSSSKNAGTKPKHAK